MRKTALLLAIVCATTSCQNTWNDDDKQAFYSVCMEDAKGWAGSGDRAKVYCDCVFAEMVKKYPNENDALEHIHELIKDSSMRNCRMAVMNR